MPISSAFTVNAVANPAAHSCAYSSTVTLALTSTSGASSITWSIEACSKSGTTLPTVTAGGTPVGSTSSFAMPSDPGDGLGRAFLVKCVVSNTLESSTQYAVVGAVNAASILPIVPGEEGARNATHGWAETVNLGLASTATPVPTSLGTPVATLAALRAVVSADRVDNQLRAVGTPVGTWIFSSSSGANFADNGEDIVRPTDVVLASNGRWYNTAASPTKATIASLRTAKSGKNDRCRVLAYSALGDGGGGEFYWDASSTTADDGGTVITPTGLATGRWKRQYTGDIYAAWFGAIDGASAAVNTAAIQAALDVAGPIGVLVYMPPGTLDVQLKPLIVRGNSSGLFGASTAHLVSARGTSLRPASRSLAISSCTGNGVTIVLGFASAHGLETGMIAFVRNVAGNTAANGNFLVTATDSTHITLNDSTGNGAWTPGTGEVGIQIVSAASRLQRCKFGDFAIRFTAGSGYAVGLDMSKFNYTTLVDPYVVLFGPGVAFPHVESLYNLDNGPYYNKGTLTAVGSATTTDDTLGIGFMALSGGIGGGANSNSYTGGHIEQCLIGVSFDSAFGNHVSLASESNWHWHAAFAHTAPNKTANGNVFAPPYLEGVIASYIAYWGNGAVDNKALLTVATTVAADVDPTSYTLTGNAGFFGTNVNDVSRVGSHTVAKTFSAAVTCSDTATFSSTVALNGNATITNKRIIKKQTTAPTVNAASTTGLGASGAATIGSGGNDDAFLVTLTVAGAGPGSNGVVEITFNTATPNAFTPIVNATLKHGSALWDLQANVKFHSTVGAGPYTGVKLQWSNNAVALSAGQTYQIAVSVQSVST